MTGYLIMGALCVIFGLFAYFAFKAAHTEKQLRKEAEAAIKYQKKVMEEYENAEKKKAAANTGDIKHDVDVMANELRNL